MSREPYKARRGYTVFKRFLLLAVIVLSVTGNIKYTLIPIGVFAYTSLAMFLNIPLRKLIRKIQWSYVREVIENRLKKGEKYSLIAYPIMIGLEFNEKYYKEQFIKLGYTDKFLNVITKTAFSGPPRTPEQQKEYEEIQQLQKEAMELQHIADDATQQMLFWNPQAKAWRRKNYIHKSSDKTRRWSPYETEETHERFRKLVNDAIISEIAEKSNMNDDLKNTLNENGIAPADPKSQD